MTPWARSGSPRPSSPSAFSAPLANLARERRGAHRERLRASAPSSARAFSCPPGSCTCSRTPRKTSTAAPPGHARVLRRAARVDAVRGRVKPRPDPDARPPAARRARRRAARARGARASGSPETGGAKRADRLPGDPCTAALCSARSRSLVVAGLSLGASPASRSSSRSRAPLRVVRARHAVRPDARRRAARRARMPAGAVAAWIALFALVTGRRARWHRAPRRGRRPQAAAHLTAAAAGPRTSPSPRWPSPNSRNRATRGRRRCFSCSGTQACPRWPSGFETRRLEAGVNL